VLDVACGTGDLTLAFADARPASVTGVDFTAQMLEVAREKSRRMGGREPVYVQGDAMNLPFADRSFDIVSIAWGIRNVADPLKVLREFHRVLRPGGCCGRPIGCIAVTSCHGRPR
jgi:demethylmenaquinone methyltransferase/2-methoxy-6-polyprenyl-1,4-benzoquinol methylase